MTKPKEIIRGKIAPKCLSFFHEMISYKENIAKNFIEKMQQSLQRLFLFLQIFSCLEKKYFSFLFEGQRDLNEITYYAIIILRTLFKQYGQKCIHSICVIQDTVSQGRNKTMTWIISLCVCFEALNPKSTNIHFEAFMPLIILFSLSPKPYINKRNLLISITGSNAWCISLFPYH